MFQSRGSGFLGSALTTAAGVAGGMVAGNALMNLFSGSHQSGFGGGGFGGGGYMPEPSTSHYTPTSQLDAPAAAWAPPAQDGYDVGGLPKDTQSSGDSSSGGWQDAPAAPEPDTGWQDASGGGGWQDASGGSDDP